MVEKISYSDCAKLDFSKLRDRRDMPVLPAIIIDAETGKLLMVGFMNDEAYIRTIEDGEVTFWSRAKNGEEGKLWKKGETSGNKLIVQNIKSDCDDDTIAIYVNPRGPVCHRGTFTCFDEEIEFEEDSLAADIIISISGICGCNDLLLSDKGTYIPSIRPQTKAVIQKGLMQEFAFLDVLLKRTDKFCPQVNIESLRKLAEGRIVYDGIGKAAQYWKELSERNPPDLQSIGILSRLKQLYGIGIPEIEFLVAGQTLIEKAQIEDLQVF